MDQGIQSSAPRVQGSSLWVYKQRNKQISIYLSLCMYLCMYVCMYACMYVYIYVGTNETKFSACV